MKEQARILQILMNGIIVGKLVKTKKGALEFTYDTNWLNLPAARPVSLSLPLIEQTFTGDVVYNFFDNLLPDNPLIRARIQAKFQTAMQQPFDLLASIGKDCVGAIQIVTQDEMNFTKQIDYQPLNEKQIADLLRNYQNNPLGMSNDDSEFRISIAGAQEKAAFLYWQDKWCRPVGTTPTTHIFKLPIGSIPHQGIDLTDSCENEWLCSQIVAAFDLPIAKCEIKKFVDVKVLIVERFDRKLASDGSWIMRLPQEDICQALGVSPNLKYQSDGGPGIKEVMRLLLGSANTAIDRDLFYRAQVLFWLLAATDAHAKNFSVHIEAQGKYRLTPLYDVMSVYPLLIKKQLQAKKIKMAMSLTGSHNNRYLWHDVQRRYFLKTAKAVDYSTQKAEHILDEMLEQVEPAIQRVSRALPKDFPNSISQPIFEGMMQMKRNLA